MSYQVLTPRVNPQMNLGAPELEFIDPTPDVHALFLHFDQLFFKSSLKSRATVRWSKRMYSCAGTCAYEGRSGFCDIAISEPLLKLRPRKDLVETLLHEMIHAFLFITDRDRDRDGHGPNFHYHMNRINKLAGLNISVYHDFQAEVALYQTHWWRCDGICRNTRPHYGIVRRTVNRPPGPYDPWWDAHIRWCGGKYVKIKQPDEKVTKNKKGKVIDDIAKVPKKKDISQKSIDNFVTVESPSNAIKTLNEYYKKKTQGSEITITVVSNGKENTNGETVQDKVRNAWANYPYPANITINTTNKNPQKHKIDTTDSQKPKRLKKIDDYFKVTASSIIKDIYGTTVKLVESKNEKLKAVIEPETRVDCPICNTKVLNSNINSHVDECLNKDVIENLKKDGTIEIDKTNDISNHTTINNKDVNTKIGIKQEIKKEYDVTSHNIMNKNINYNITNKVPKTEVKLEPTINIKTEIKTEPGTSHNTNTDIEILIQECACCGEMIQKSMQDHLDECLAFFKNNTTIPDEGINQSTSVIILDDDDDDQFNESHTLNPTGTKYPCPSCLKLVENDEMNGHLDSCLN